MDDLPGRYQEAEHDCSRAIALDSSYSKAFARRGTARAAMRKLKEAKEGASSNDGAWWRRKKPLSDVNHSTAVDFKTNWDSVVMLLDLVPKWKRNNFYMNAST